MSVKCLFTNKQRALLRGIIKKFNTFISTSFFYVHLQQFHFCIFLLFRLPPRHLNVVAHKFETVVSPIFNYFHPQNFYLKNSDDKSQKLSNFNQRHWLITIVVQRSLYQLCMCLYLNCNNHELNVSCVKCYLD